MSFHVNFVCRDDVLGMQDVRGPRALASPQDMSASEYVGKWCNGRVKSFHRKNGWGFISCDNFAEDVFVGLKNSPELESIVSAFGDPAGCEVRFLLADNQKKAGSYEAKGVTLKNGKGKGASPGSAKKGGGFQATSGYEWVEATFKSFNPEKGWGFLTSDRTYPDDIMVSYKLAPNLRFIVGNVGNVHGLPVLCKMQESTHKPGSFEAVDIQVMSDRPPMMFGAGFNSYGPAPMGKGSKSRAAAMTPYAPAAMTPYAPAAMTPYAPFGCAGKGKMMQFAAGGRKGAHNYVGKMVPGYVKSFNPSKSWGFVKSELFADDCMFVLGANSHLQGQDINSGMEVKFIVSPSKKQPGSYEASNVQISGDGKHRSSASNFLGQRVSGYVKSFSAKSGWGFIKSDEFFDDCFFKASSEDHVPRNAGVTFKVAKSTNRPGSFEATDVELTGESVVEGSAIVASAQGYVGETVQGYVKSYVMAKRWGFLKTDLFEDDVMFSVRNNPHLEGVEIEPGRQLTFTLTESTKRPGAFEATDVADIVE